MQKSSSGLFLHCHELLRGIFTPILRHLEKEAADPAKVLRLSIRLSALGVLISLVQSHDLWFQDNRLFLPSPLAAWTAAASPGVNLWLYAAMMSLCGALFLFPRCRRAGILVVPLYVFFCLQDQIRMQFYLDIFVFNLFVVALIPEKTDDAHLDPLRYMTMCVYFWGGFYKLNPFFSMVMFPWFVGTWFPYTQAAQVTGGFVPLLEMSIGICLLMPQTRKIGQVLAFCMLVVVLLSLGPFGRNISPQVWPSNIYLDSMATFLFLGNTRVFFDARAVKKPLSMLAVFCFGLLPVLGMTGTLGNHPALKLYCCGDYGEIEFSPRENLAFLPEDMQLGIRPGNRLMTSSLVVPPLHVSPYLVFSTPDHPYLAGARGICPYLSRPDEARLHVFQPVHFWSAEMSEKVYNLCGKGP